MWFILIVLYNKTLKSSTTLQGIIDSWELINLTNSNLLLWDNSPSPIASNELQYLTKMFTNFQYISTPENVHLSAIYNNAITKCINNFNRYLLLLDDDSNINNFFFEEALKNSNSGHQLLLPIIKNNGIIRSPIKYYIIKSFVFGKLSPGNMSSKNLMAINSGMIISIDFLKKYQFKYDEGLVNYGTDNYFMKFYSERCAELCMLNFELEHSLSFFDNENICRKLEIFGEIKKANLIVHKVNMQELILAYAFNLLSSIKYALKYRTLKFFR